ncbi:hypothetical protein GCM10022220_48050 [Actinocatenispora rupis]|uniref:Uncharacterized protein n=1 Tax=Actinocatenispora rupis TaxID=519421 RepID=A0A8J3J953_9ACTN|nr:hypothetical protein Aru02nite_33060 [Actinocatenispora rupis]
MAVRIVLEAGSWWVVLTAVWWATLSSAAPDDMAIGAGAAAVAAVLAVAARRIVGHHWPRAGLRWRVLAYLFVALAADTVRLFVVCLPRLVADRSRDGRLARAAVSPGGGNPSHRAAGTLLLSAAPLAYVVDWPDGRPPVLHRLGADRGALEREVLR